MHRLHSRLGQLRKGQPAGVLRVQHREAAGSGEILNLAVAPEFRRRGIGGTLLEEGLVAFHDRGAQEVFLEVRESNHSAQALYLARGFRPVGQRAAYYRNPRENALVLRLGLRQHA